MCGREDRRGVGGPPGGGQTTYVATGGMQEELPDDRYDGLPFTIGQCTAADDSLCDIAR